MDNRVETPLQNTSPREVKTATQLPENSKPTNHLSDTSAFNPQQFTTHYSVPPQQPIYQPQRKTVPVISNAPTTTSNNNIGQGMTQQKNYVTRTLGGMHHQTSVVQQVVGQPHLYANNTAPINNFQTTTSIYQPPSSTLPQTDSLTTVSRSSNETRPLFKSNLPSNNYLTNTKID